MAKCELNVVMSMTKMLVLFILLLRVQYPEDSKGTQYIQKLRAYVSLQKKW
jgi:hypothetical protein